MTLNGNLLYSIGGRKFLVVVGAGLMTSFLLFLGKLDPVNYTTITMFIIAAYIGGDAYVSTRTHSSTEKTPS